VNKENVSINKRTVKKKAGNSKTHRLSPNVNRKSSCRIYKMKPKEQNRKGDVQEGAISKYIKRELLEEIGIGLPQNINPPPNKNSNTIKGYNLILQQLKNNITLNTIKHISCSTTKSNTNKTVEVEVNTTKNEVIDTTQEEQKDIDESSENEIKMLDFNKSQSILIEDHSSTIMSIGSSYDEGLMFSSKRKEEVSLSEISEGTTSFHELTLKEFKELMKEENLSKIISIRERLLKYQEKTEKRNLIRMYECNKFSPRTYHRKKVELEKWVTKEKVEIRRGKKQFIENWKQTADIIENIHQNAIKVKQLAFENSFNSTIQLSNRTDVEAIDEDSLITPTDRKHSDTYLDKCESPLGSKRCLMFTKENEVLVKELEQAIRSPNIYITPRFDSNHAPESILKVSLEFNDKQEELSLFQNGEAIDIYQQSTIQKQGINNSAQYIEMLLDRLFAHLLKDGKNKFLAQINASFSKDLLNVLNEARTNQRNLLVYPTIIPKDIIENLVQGLPEEDIEIQKHKETYNKAICAATNDALNTLRPYGLSGEPVPWSNQQRILFKEIKDVELIVKNVKNMVHFERKALGGRLGNIWSMFK